MMGSKLQQVLRSLCFNNDWDYAVFWKLKHRSKLLITWEDAYYESKTYLEKKGFNETAVCSSDGHYSHDPLGLALAKMSYQVFSLGEGIIGEVALSGKHSWIFSDDYVAKLSSTANVHTDGWHSQFAAGIKTVVVVAELPHGILQLGSLKKIWKDMKVVNHIRNVISEMHPSPTGSMSSLLYYNMEDIFFSNMCARNDSAGFDEGESNVSWSQFFSSALIGDSSDKRKMAHERTEGSVSGIETSVLSSSEGFFNSQRGKAKIGSFGDTDFGKTVEHHFVPENVGNLGESNNLPELQNMKLHHDFDKLEVPIKSNQVGISASSPFSFCPGYELYEALGHSLHKQNGYVWDKTCPDMAIDPSEGVETTSSLLMESSDTHLLDAVVSKASHKGEGSSKSFHEVPKPHLSAENTPCTSFVTSGYSLDQETSASLNSVKCGSRGSAQSIKTSKKRARPGESGRPRPRDRQLIQDRLKELRELVPNGSKCSIDSLLERTIKHMVFLQGVTKHADKLNKCSASKLLNKETSMQRFSCGKQGSSWAVELGNSQEACPVIVENINMNGQMLIEMLCEKCNQFLDVAETITSLGLSVLKGISEISENKTWMCFLVENSRSLHRMDILWSLMQLVQRSTTDK